MDQQVKILALKHRRAAAETIKWRANRILKRKDIKQAIMSLVNKINFHSDKDNLMLEFLSVNFCFSFLTASLFFCVSV